MASNGIKLNEIPDKEFKIIILSMLKEIEHGKNKFLNEFQENINGWMKYESQTVYDNTWNLDSIKRYKYLGKHKTKLL